MARMENTGATENSASTRKKRPQQRRDPGHELGFREGDHGLPGGLVNLT